MPGRESSMRRRPDYRLGRLLQGLRRRQQIRPHRQLGSFQVRLGQRSGGHAPRPAAHLASEATALRAAGPCHQQQRPEGEPLRGDHRGDPDRSHLSGHRHRSGRHVQVDTQTCKRQHVPRRQHGRHDRRPRQGNRAGGHPNHRQRIRRQARQGRHDHHHQGAGCRMGDVYRNIYRHKYRHAIHLPKSSGRHQVAPHGQLD